jgi:phosphatidylserine/phosphatidylglycerophosphate/cardiolipin synthase-like enzyme
MVIVRALVTPAEVLAALQDAVAWCEGLYLAYAWASSGEGAAKHWKLLPLQKVRQAVIGVHFGQTEPLVLYELRDLGVLRVVPDSGGVFHPKLLVARKGSHARVLTGSSNFTAGGFAGNTEVNVMLAGSLGEEPIKKLIAFVDEQWKHPRSFEPSDEWLAQYGRRTPLGQARPRSRPRGRRKGSGLRATSPSTGRRSWI